MKNNFVRFGRCYENITPERNVSLEIKPKHSEKESDNILSEIFAPDPCTGHPSSDLYFVMSKDKDPVISQYIQDTLLKSNESVSAPALSTADDALATVKTSAMSLNEYKQNLKNLLVYDKSDSKK